MLNYSFFIGADVSKAVIDVSYHQDNEAIYLGQFPNSSVGFKRMLRRLSKITSVDKHLWFFCFENTGVYSKPFFRWLYEEKLACREENALKISKSLGFRRAKNDKIDSEDICQYAFEKRDSIEASKLPEPIIEKLLKLLHRRDFLVSKRQAIKTSVKEQKGFIDDDLFNELDASNQEIILVFNKQIKKLEQSIKELVDSNEEIKCNDQLARSVIGIGPITSAYMIATTNNFKSFSDARKYACYCGVAPFPNSSGIRTGKSRVSHIANKRMKSIFSNCIMAALKHDSQLAAYHKRKIQAGKRPGIVLNALKNKLIQRVFAVIKRKTPFVQIMTYA